MDKYVVKRIVNRSGSEVTWDVYFSTRAGFEFVAEFTKKSDAEMFKKVANARMTGKRVCI